MELHTHFPLFLSIITISSFFSTTLPLSHGNQDDHYTACNTTYSCGKITNISYPFWGQNRPRSCGSSNSLELKCDQDNNTFIEIGSQNFTVLSINNSPFTMRLARRDLVSWSCPSDFTKTSLNSTAFHYNPDKVENLTLFYKCPQHVSESLPRDFKNTFTCQSESDKQAFYVNQRQVPKYQEHLLQCEGHVEVPVSREFPLGNEGGIQALRELLEHGYDVQYFSSREFSDCAACHASGGMCGSGVTNTSLFSCYCRDGAHDSVCSTNDPNPFPPSPNFQLNQGRGGRRTHLTKLHIGLIATGGIVALLACAVLCYFRRKLLLVLNLQHMTKNDEDIEAFIRNHGPLSIKRYTFSDIKKITKSFEVKLGEGGYGVVYKGCLINGCSVAVKVLNASKGNGQEFINEVVSISKTSHVNVVNLLGFCLESRKKALVYEYMSNGSLDKFINNKDSKTNPPLSWERLHQIAIGIARGLEYLHRGCNTRILHFDIKPNNILLDKDFCPKIGDFGLAKLCSNTNSIVSMLDARGTIGYIAPEVWSRTYGEVSHKSDVYSYGMVIFEMVGGKKNMANEMNDTSEIYFPHWMHRHVEVGSNETWNGATTREENEIAKKMITVGLWCIQTIPSHRPTMSKVIEMLEGRLQQLETPPKPFEFSPQRTEKYSVASGQDSSSSFYK